MPRRLLAFQKDIQFSESAFPLFASNARRLLASQQDIQFSEGFCRFVQLLGRVGFEGMQMHAFRQFRKQ
jgi:hypothetical protein